MHALPPAEPRKGPGAPGGQLQKACTAGGHAVWTVYRTFLSGTVSQVVPEATRDALFQLFCDVRANVPKDKRFVQRHLKAFKPHTVVGWLVRDYSFIYLRGCRWLSV